MAEANSYRKRVAKPRGQQAARSPVTKQQVDDDSPNKRQCLNDVVSESTSLTKVETKQLKISSKEKDKETRNGGLVNDSQLTPTRPAPRPPFSRNALPYASLPVAPPKPPRTYEQSPSSSLYPSLSPTFGDRTDSERNRKTVIPTPAPRGRINGEPAQQKEAGVFTFDDGKVVYPLATQRWEKRKNAKENFPLNSRDIVPEEPTKMPVSARLMKWKLIAEVTNAETAALRRMANRGQEFHVERSRKALSSSLERSTPCPAPRSGARSDSNDRMLNKETHDGNATKGATYVDSAYEKIEEPLSVVQTGSKERFYRKQKDTFTVDSNATKTPQKKRYAPLPPSTNTNDDNKEMKPKNRLYPDITDTSTHDYFVLEEPESSLQKQPKTSNVEDSPERCSLDVYGVSGSIELDEPAIESSKRLVPECLVGLTVFPPEVCASICGDNRRDWRSNSQPGGNGYSLAGAAGDDKDEDDVNENIYCEIDSPASLHGSLKMEAHDKSSFKDSKPKGFQKTHLHADQHVVMKQRPVLCMESEHLVENRSPAKPFKPMVPSMTPTSPGTHRLVWPKKGAPTITISHELHGNDSQDKADDFDDLPFIPDPLVKLRLQTLQDLVYQELSVIHQTSNALAQCCHDLSAFSGSAEALECHRIVLMACKKREAYMIEMQRLREGRSGIEDAGPRGILTVCNIRLPLKPEFMSKIGTAFDTSVHHFVVLIRHGCNVVFTQMLSTHMAMVRGSLDFPDAFEIGDVRQNLFNVDVEVYGMSVERTPGAYSSKKKKKALNPMKALTPSCTRRPLDSSSLGSVRTSNFINIASLHLDYSHFSKVNFSLERPWFVMKLSVMEFNLWEFYSVLIMRHEDYFYQIPFSSPLRGSIHLELGCQMESQVEERGFLTMFENRCGFGTWYRRWCALKCNRLLYWKYPGEEYEKDPIGFVDLKQCVSDKVDLVSRSYCARPNTFEMIIRRTQQTKGNDNSEGHDEPVKLWFSSDTKEERLNWCSQLNEALVNLRTWHNDAAKPDKS